MGVSGLQTAKLTYRPNRRIAGRWQPPKNAVARYSYSRPVCGVQVLFVSSGRQQASPLGVTYLSVRCPMIAFDSPRRG